MNENTPATNSVDITPSETSLTAKGSGLTNKVSLIGTGILATIIIVSAVSYFVYNKKDTQSEQVAIILSDKDTLKQDKENLEKFSLNSTYEGQLAYKKSVDAFLANPNLSQDTRNMLLLRKGIVLATRRGSQEIDTKTGDEATAIFTNFIDTIPPFSEKSTTTPTNIFIRDFSLVAFANQQVQCCGKSSSIKSTHLENIIKPYLAKGYPETLAGFMTLHTLLGEISQNQLDDLKAISLAIYVDSEILNKFKTQITSEDSVKVTKDLKNKIDFFPYGVTRTYTDLITKEVESKSYYAYGFDTYYSNLGTLPTKELNAKIDTNYKLVDTAIETSLKKGSNPTSLNIMRIVNSTKELSSMQRRYGTAMDKKYLDETITKIMTAIHSSPDVKAFADSHFKNYKQYDNIGYFVQLAKTNKTVADYVTSIGIDVATIQ